MSAEVDRELELWRADWQAEAPPGADTWPALRRRVMWRSRGLVVMAVLEAAWTAVVVGLLIRTASRLGTAVDAAFAAGFCLLAVGLLCYSAWNRRGVWRPATATPGAFVDLAVLRCRRRRRSVRVAWWVLAGEDAGLIVWMAHRLAAQAAAGTMAPAAPWVVCALLAGLTLAVGGICAAVGRYTSREQRRLEELRDRLQE